MIRQTWGGGGGAIAPPAPMSGSYNYALVIDSELEQKHD